MKSVTHRRCEQLRPLRELSFRTVAVVNRSAMNDATGPARAAANRIEARVSKECVCFAAMRNQDPVHFGYSERGFTLLELLITVAVLAIVLAIGVPSFADMIRNNRLASESNELVTSITLARSEALKRGIPVSVCPRSGATCADSTDWSNGWLVFTDDLAPTGALNAPTDAVLLSSSANDSGVSITSDKKSVTYTSTGARTKTQWTVTKSGCKGKNKRLISVELTGRVSLVKDNC